VLEAMGAINHRRDPCPGSGTGAFRGGATQAQPATEVETSARSQRASAVLIRLRWRADRPPWRLAQRR